MGLPSVATTVKVTLATVLIPYFIGWKLSDRLVPDTVLHRYLVDPLDENQADPPSLAPLTEVSSEECEKRLSELLDESLWKDFKIILHRNGQAQECSNSPISLDWQGLQKTLETFDYCVDEFDKYDVDSLLTRLLGRILSQQEGDTTCENDDLYEPMAEGLFGFCDRGPDKTPQLLDHDKLVPVPLTETLPCHFHTREGLRITSLPQLQQVLASATSTEKTCQNPQEGQDEETCNDDSPALHLYAVPAGRMFMFAPSYVGEEFDLQHVTGSEGKQVRLKVMSVSPVVFDVFNFFSKDESQDLVTRALNEKSESHRIKRSSTGASGYHVNSKRTSENGFDTHGKTAQAVKHRCFDILGFDEYIESHSDGLQILRYNKTTAYVPHMDWIDDPSKSLKHNYDSGGVGGNRFATVLLYMSDLQQDGQGGETVFAKGWPTDLEESKRLSHRQALAELRASNIELPLKKGSWEEDMVAKCRSRLAIRPDSARAVLFYSQLPNGEPDPASLHGGCPVLDGEKWAANLWVWNTPRDGFPGSPLNPNYKAAPKKEPATANPTPQYTKISATFENSGKDDRFEKAQLYYKDDTLWGDLGFGSAPLSVNTYQGHIWNVKVDGKTEMSWEIQEGNGIDQKFTI